MAIISTLIGGICGFLTFIVAWMFFDVSFLNALALYFAVGLGLTAMLIIAGLSWQALKNMVPARVSIRAYPLRATVAHALPKHRN